MSGSVAEGVSTRSGSAKGNRDMSAVDQTVKQVIAERGGRPVASSTEEFVTPMDDEARRAFVAQRKASKTVRLREARKEGRTRPASKPRAVQSTTSQTPAKKASPSSIAQKLAQQKINEARQQERRQLAARTNPLEYRSQLEQRLVKDPKSPGGVDRTSRRRVKAVKRRQRIARNELKAFEIELAIAAKEGVVLPAELAVQA